MSDGELPPPPYIEQEFDRKVSEALVLSSQAYENHIFADQDQWEEWSEAAFAAAEARANGQTAEFSGAGSSSQVIATPSRDGSYASASHQAPLTVQPLKIHKRGKSGGSPAMTLPKPRPNWMDQAEFGQSSVSPSAWVTEPQPLARHTQNWNAAQPPHQIIPDGDEDEDEDHSAPPPPFAAMGPPIDGIVRLEYHPESTPPSPLASSTPDHLMGSRTGPIPSFALPPRPARSEYHPESPPPLATTAPTQVPPQPPPASLPSGETRQQQFINPRFRLPRQPLPIPPCHVNYRPEQRPMSTASPFQHPGRSVSPSVDPPRSPNPPQQSAYALPAAPIHNPRVAFNAACSNRTQLFAPYQPSPQSFDPSAFYNSSVSSHLSSAGTIQHQQSYSSLQHRALDPTLVSRAGGQNASPIHMNYLTASQASYVPYSTGASPFFQRPAYSSTYNPSTPHRWATSEQDFTQNFQ